MTNIPSDAPSPFQRKSMRSSIEVDAIANAAGATLGLHDGEQDFELPGRLFEQLPFAVYVCDRDGFFDTTATLATVRLSNSGTSDDLKQLIEGRIDALAKVHTLFVESRWAGAELHRLATQELLAYGGEKEGRVRIEGPVVMLEPITAQTTAISLHELATNAAKYGSLSAAGGHVEIS